MLVLIGLCSHPVWLGLMSGFLFGEHWHMFPNNGYCDLFSPTTNCGGPVQWTDHLLLPWLIFGLLNAAVYMIMFRALVIDELGQDYVRTARAKGAGNIRVVRGHVLKNVMPSFMTMLGMNMGVALGGVIFVESAFGLPARRHASPVDSPARSPPHRGHRRLPRAGDHAPEPDRRSGLCRLRSQGQAPGPVTPPGMTPESAPQSRLGLDFRGGDDQHPKVPAVQVTADAAREPRTAAPGIRSRQGDHSPAPVDLQQRDVHVYGESSRARRPALEPAFVLPAAAWPQARVEQLPVPRIPVCQTGPAATRLTSPSCRSTRVTLPAASARLVRPTRCIALPSSAIVDHVTRSRRDRAAGARRLRHERRHLPERSVRGHAARTCVMSPCIATAETPRRSSLLRAAPLRFVRTNTSASRIGVEQPISRSILSVAVTETNACSTTPSPVPMHGARTEATRSRVCAGDRRPPSCRRVTAWSGARPELSGRSGLAAEAHVEHVSASSRTRIRTC